MKRLVILSIWIMLIGCATHELQPITVDGLFNDQLFAPATVAIRAEDALEMTPAMRDYARTRIPFPVGHVNNKDVRHTLVDSLYVKGQLKLEYNSAVTRTASEAFTEKSGNCLSLVLLTASMARELKIPYHYQLVVNSTDWNLSDQLFMSIGHVNIVLESVPNQFELQTWSADPVVIDFLTPDKAAELNTEVISENTILAMYLNNRAVETLVQGNINNAYWWAQAAIKQDDQFLNAYLTLGIIYRNIGHPELSEKVLERISTYYPDNPSVISDQILALKDLGRQAETVQLQRRLLILDQQRPWSYYFEGQREFNAGHFDNALRLYAKELARNPEHHEIEYGLAVTYDKLGDRDNARLHLRRAIALCKSRQVRERYMAELDQMLNTTSR